MSRRDDDWDDDDRPRRRRNEYDEEDDYDRGPRRSGGRSGSVTGVGVYGIVLGSLVLLLGICALVGVIFVGAEGGARGMFQIPGMGGGFAIAVIIVMLILAWSILTIVGSIGVLNRRQSGRIITFIVAGLGGVYGLLCVIVAVAVLAQPDPLGVAGGAKAFAFLLYLIIGALFITYLIWAMVALIKNGYEFR